MKIEFEIEGRPRPQKRPKVYSRRAVDPSAGDKQCFLLQAMGYRPDPVPSGPVEIRLVFGYASLVRSADIDNLAKLVMDALNGVFYHDDRQVVLLRAAKVTTAGSEFTRVYITYQ